MEGKEIPQCETCNHKLLNAQVYRQHFNRMFENQIDEAFEKTDEAGHTTMEVTSFDYRFSNLCNFTCRMCGPPLSSSWETEEKKHGVFDYKEQPWGDKEIQKEINKFHDQQIIKEFQEAIESKKIKVIPKTSDVIFVVFVTFGILFTTNYFFDYVLHN